MNEDLLYTLDPYIIAILFKLKDDEKTLDVYTRMVESLDFVFKETIKEYLIENKFSEEDVKKVVEAEDLETLEPRFKPYLQNIILANRVQANSKQFIKLYYDQLLPNLNEQEKSDLESYIKDNEELLKQRKEGIIEGLNELKAILVENGVNSYDELVDKYESGKEPKSEAIVEASPAEEIKPIEVQPIQSPVVEKPVATPVDPMASIVPVAPVKATIVEDEPTQNNVNIPAPTEPEKPIVNETVAPLVEAPQIQQTQAQPQQPESAPAQTATGPNLVSQLADMGISLDDGLNTPPAN